jgi:hypothetical protein
VSYYYRPHVVLSSDEIEVACDALWSAKGWAGWDDDQERLWERLQPIRTGDYGGSATIELKPEEEAAVGRALRCCVDQVELDEDEQGLLLRLTEADDAA